MSTKKDKEAETPTNTAAGQPYSKEEAKAKEPLKKVPLIDGEKNTHPGSEDEDKENSTMQVGTVNPARADGDTEGPWRGVERGPMPGERAVADVPGGAKAVQESLAPRNPDPNATPDGSAGKK